MLPRRKPSRPWAPIAGSTWIYNKRRSSFKENGIKLDEKVTPDETRSWPCDPVGTTAEEDKARKAATEADSDLAGTLVEDKDMKAYLDEDSIEY